MAGVSKGLIRTVRVNEQLVTDMIPVDIPINMMIAAAWNKATNSLVNSNTIYFVIDLTGLVEGQRNKYWCTIVRLVL